MCPEYQETDSEILFMAELRREFLEKTRTDLPRMEEAFAAGDLAGVAVIAHDIKGTAGVFGLHEMSDSGRLLQAAAQEGRMEESRQLIEHLKEQLAQALGTPPQGTNS